MEDYTRDFQKKQHVTFVVDQTETVIMRTGTLIAAEMKHK